MKSTKLNKAIWTEGEFGEMQWHDCKIYAIAFDEERFELLFDIDYIVEWVTLKESKTSYKFWVVPATMVFRNVHDIHIALYSVDFRIQDVSRKNPSKPKNADYIKDEFEYDWMFDTTGGNISFKAVGYNQYARRDPILLDSQYIDTRERGAISFARG